LFVYFLAKLPVDLSHVKADVKIFLRELELIVEAVKMTIKGAKLTLSDGISRTSRPAYLPSHTKPYGLV
jgi:hypothetical protein